MLTSLLLLTASAAPPTAAEAAHWELGVGVVNNIQEADLIGVVDGGRVLARRVHPGWAFEVQLYGSPDTGRYPALAEQLVAELSGGDGGAYVMPVVQDVAGLSAMLEWRGLPHAQHERAGLRLCGGLELRGQRVRVLRDEQGPVLSEAAVRRVGGAVLGVGWHMQRDLVGARLALYDRISPSPTSYPMAAGAILIETPRWLSHAPTLALDVVFQL